MTAGVLAVQPVLLAALLMGFRHAVRVPAELAANWAVQVAWAGDTRRHVAGAKAAGALLFVVVPVLALLPLYAAAVHAARRRRDRAVRCSPAASVMLEAIFLGYRKMPFACGYLPANLKTLAPIAFVVVRLLHLPVRAPRAGGARSRHRARRSPPRLAVLFLVLRAIDAVKRRTVRPFEFDEMPEPPTQRLGLS